MTHQGEESGWLAVAAWSTGPASQRRAGGTVSEFFNDGQKLRSSASLPDDVVLARRGC